MCCTATEEYNFVFPKGKKKSRYYWMTDTGMIAKEKSQ